MPELNRGLFRLSGISCHASLEFRGEGCGDPGGRAAEFAAIGKPSQYQPLRLRISLLIKATGNQQCAAYLRPTLLRQSTQNRTEAVPLAQREVIEVNRTRRRHAVFFR